MADDRHQHPNEPIDSHEAFLRLWTHHELELRAFVRSCCPRAQEVDEVLQDVSIVAWGGSVTLNWLSTLPEVDMAKVVCTGHSRGGLNGGAYGDFLAFPFDRS